MLPNVQHRTSQELNNGLERDHCHLNQRRYPMRGFKQAICAALLARGHGLIQYQRNGCSILTATVPRLLRRMTAWSQLIQAISLAL